MSKRNRTMRSGFNVVKATGYVGKQNKKPPKHHHQHLIFYASRIVSL